MKKAVIVSLAVLCVVLFATTAYASEKGCGGWFEPSCRPSDSFKDEVRLTEENQKDVIAAVPTPKLQTSQERKNIKRRLETFNAEDKISYIYLISFGKVMSFYTVQGKVSSVNSYLTPMERLINNKGETCNGWNDSGGCYPVEAPDLDGSYGTNGDAIFFFTTEGVYVEWNGEYMVADQPLKMATQPELVREIQ